MKKIAILTSGHSRGSNFRNICEYIKENKCDIQIEFLLVTDASAPVIELARQQDIKIVYFLDKKYFDKSLIDLCETYELDLIVLAGFIRKIPREFLQRIKTPIVNIHPALLPKYGGKGMYGMYVHETVFKSKETVSGATVHLVNEHYDEGKILQQKSCDISKCISPQEIADTVIKIEHEIYPKTIVKILQEDKV
ncbi:MAG: phosphoribosylglycinamide formyltransferase [Candidatus Cloacimonetes bacterium]|nr:phosphoribosylglycinamide formyltransferase [Candidatus Cloacimonadota bacterium]